MIYMDANVFINAAVGLGELGKTCRNILDLVENKNGIVSTSALTFDEVLWKLRNFMGYAEAIKSVRATMELPIHIIQINANTIYEALNIAENFKLKPRDAIHASCMFQENISQICSTDSDFDVLNYIERIHPDKLKL